MTGSVVQPAVTEFSLHEQEGGVVVQSEEEGAAAAVEFEPGLKVHGTRRQGLG